MDRSVLGPRREPRHVMGHGIGGLEVFTRQCGISILRALGLLGVSVFLGSPSGAAAQVVTGQVKDSGTGAPVSAALVELMRSDSTQVAATLTDSGGRYTIQTTLPGAYSIRVRRLGYSTRSVEQVVETRTHRVDIELVSQPVQLEGIVATGRSVCENGPGVGPGTLRLWNLIVDVLDVAQLAQTLDSYRFDLLLYVRDRTLDGRHVLVDVAERSYETGAFVAMPLEKLEDQGYVEPHYGGLLSWYMPDPAVLSSDRFRETHCFRVVEHEDPGLVGLGFDPTPQRSDDRPDERNDSYEQLFGDDVVEVRGVLWVDRVTGALSHLEYDYVGIRDSAVDALAGGSAYFEQLSGGLWIVRQWLLRMPKLRVDDGRIVPEARREAGGYVVQAVNAALDDERSAVDPVGRSSALPAGTVGSLVGRLVPSDAPIPISDAVIRLSGSSRAAPTYSDGRFVFRDVPPGEYAVTWSSPQMQALDLPPSAVDVVIEDGRESTVVLPGPDLEFAADYQCPGMEVDPGLGIVRVRTEGSRIRGTPGPNGLIELRFVTLRSRTPAIEFEETKVAQSEFVRFCGVPTGVPLEAELGDSLPPVPFDLGPHGMRQIRRQ